MENKEEVTQEELNRMPLRNAQVTKDGYFYVEINHPEHGWIPFNAMPDDTEEHGRKIFERIPKEFKVIPQMVEEEEPVIESGPTIEERLLELEKKLK